MVADSPVAYAEQFCRFTGKIEFHTSSRPQEKFRLPQAVVCPLRAVAVTMLSFDTDVNIDYSVYFLAVKWILQPRVSLI